MLLYRSAQQFTINRHLDKMNIDDLVNERYEEDRSERAKEGTFAAEDLKSGSSVHQEYQ